MRILAVSDKTDTPLQHAHFLRQRAGDVKLIIGCGDLPGVYLDYLASALNKPLLYVRGNHFWVDGRQGTYLDVGVNLDGRVVRERGLLIGGLEGSMRYKPGQAQYTDSEMWRKALRLMPRLALNRFVRGRAIDILVTHAPPRGIHDRPDRTHQGFRAFLRLMEWFRPQYLLHGHIHVWDRRERTCTRYLQTMVVNVYPWRVVEIDHDLEAYGRGRRKR